LVGSRMEYHVRQGLDERPRTLLYSVQDFAEKIERYLKSIPDVTNVSAAGSLRRKQDTIGDLNFLVAGKGAASIFKRFATLGSVRSWEARRNEGSFSLSSGLTVTLQWTTPREWGLSLLVATWETLPLVMGRARAIRRRRPRNRRSDNGVTSPRGYSVQGTLHLKVVLQGCPTRFCV
jgi:DNA polymerase (family 10)